MASPRVPPRRVGFSSRRALAVAAGRSAGREVPVLLVDDTLAPSSSARPVAALELDADGLPVLRDGERWPLELD